MTRCVEEINAVTVVVELQDGGADGNAALTFQFHPVRSCGALMFSRRDGTGQLHCAAVKKQFFRQRRLARVWMRNNRKGASALNFFCYIHNKSAENSTTTAGDKGLKNLKGDSTQKSIPPQCRLVFFEIFLQPLFGDERNRRAFGVVSKMFVMHQRFANQPDMKIGILQCPNLAGLQFDGSLTSWKRFQATKVSSNYATLKHILNNSASVFRVISHEVFAELKSQINAFKIISFWKCCRMIRRMSGRFQLLKFAASITGDFANGREKFFGGNVRRTGCRHQNPPLAKTR